MNLFTVVLLLPDFLQDGGNDNYVAFVTAKNAKEAVDAAKEQARLKLRCKRQGLAELITFHGHCSIARHHFEP